jgi:hypothetical protein
LEQLPDLSSFLHHCSSSCAVSGSEEFEGEMPSLDESQCGLTLEAGIFGQ